MSQDIREFLSAIIDEEGNDIDHMRLNSATSEDRDFLARMYAVQAVLHREHQQSVEFTRIDLRRSIANALESEVNHTALPIKDAGPSSSPVTKSGMKLATALSRMAVAATVSFVVLFGWSQLQSQGGDANSNIVKTEDGSGFDNPSQLLDPSTRYQASTGSSFLQAKPTFQEGGLPVDLRKRIAKYRNMHANHATYNLGYGSLPMARVIEQRTVQ